jgi:hypothetical protein
VAVRLASSIAGLTALLLLASVVPVASGSTPTTRLLGDAVHFRLTWQVRPTSILYTGDGSGILGGFDGTGASHPGHLRWLSWTRSRAVGFGAVWLDDCSPSCASGTFTAHTVKVVAFRPVRGHFTRLTLLYHGGHRAKRWAIGRIGGSWGYYIVGHKP